MTIALKGYVTDNLGGAIVGAAVALQEAGTGVNTSTTTTGAGGVWEFTGVDATKTWQIKVTNGLKVIWLDGRSKVQVTDLDVRGVVNGVTKFATTEVFASAQPPAAYTDLDLSAVVGVKQRMVLLKVTNTTVGLSVGLSFRRNGDTAAPGAGVSYALIAAGGTETAFVLVSTDTAGVIEWQAVAATGRTASVNVESYW